MEQMQDQIMFLMSAYKLCFMLTENSTCNMMFSHKTSPFTYVPVDTNTFVCDKQCPFLNGVGAAELCCCGCTHSSESGEEGNASHRERIEKKQSSQYGERSSEMAQIILLYTLISLN